MNLKAVVHEIRIQNQVIFLDPPIEHARQMWIRQMHEWLGQSVHRIARVFTEANLETLKVSYVCCDEYKVLDTKLGSRCKAQQLWRQPTRHWCVHNPGLVPHGLADT